MTGHDVEDFDAYVLTAEAAKHGRRYPPAKLRFHEVTLRTHEQARADEMKAASGIIYRATPDDAPVVVFGPGAVENFDARELVKGEVNG